jgi:hypothetical protein
MIFWLSLTPPPHTHTHTHTLLVRQGVKLDLSPLVI